MAHTLHLDGGGSVRLAIAADLPTLGTFFADYRRTIALFDADINVDEPLQVDWFERPGELVPFIIESHDCPVGFAFVMGERYAAAIGQQVQWVLYDLFLQSQYRGTRLAERALTAICDQLKGTWSIDVFDANSVAIGFYQRALARHSYRRLPLSVAAAITRFSFTTLAPR